MSLRKEGQPGQAVCAIGAQIRASARLASSRVLRFDFPASLIHSREPLWQDCTPGKGWQGRQIHSISLTLESIAIPKLPKQTSFLNCQPVAKPHSQPLRSLHTTYARSKFGASNPESAASYAIRRSGSSKWAALPCFVFWLLLVTAIWLSLLGWARIVSGAFSIIEIAMTMIAGLASLLGIVRALGMRSGVRAWPATAAVFLVAVLQVVALRLSLLPAIAHP